MLSQASQAMVGPARRLLSLECVQNLNTFCVIGCVILSWCHGRVKYFWTPKFAWTHCHDKKFYLTTSLPVALWRLLAGTVMVEGHGIESCHGTAERSQEKVMVLLSVGAHLDKHKHATCNHGETEITLSKTDTPCRFCKMLRRRGTEEIQGKIYQISRFA